MEKEKPVRTRCIYPEGSGEKEKEKIKEEKSREEGSRKRGELESSKKSLKPNEEWKEEKKVSGQKGEGSMETKWEQINELRKKINEQISKIEEQNKRIYKESDSWKGGDKMEEEQHENIPNKEVLELEKKEFGAKEVAQEDNKKELPSERKEKELPSEQKEKEFEPSEQKEKEIEPSEPIERDRVEKEGESKNQGQCEVSEPAPEPTFLQKWEQLRSSRNKKSPSFDSKAKAEKS